MSEIWIIKTSPDVSGTIILDTNFISNSTNYTGVIIINSNIQYRISVDESETAYTNSSWVNNAFRTIVLSENASGDLLTWLEANATKYEPSTDNTIKFGSFDIDMLYFGSSEVDAIYFGLNKVWEKVAGWEYPVQTGTNLKITQVLSSTQSSSYLKIK